MSIKKQDPIVKFTATKRGDRCKLCGGALIDVPGNSNLWYCEVCNTPHIGTKEGYQSLTMKKGR